ncbi:MAG: hypothetical protein RLZZ450_7643 [Pseudomonadota bacterium]
MRTLQATLLLALLLACACSDQNRSSRTLLDGASHAGGDASVDTGIDASGGSCRDRIECVGPPIGCRYVGGDPCFSCGAIVCDDAAVVTRLDAGGDAASTLHDAATSNQDASTIDQETSLECGAKGFPRFSRACQTQAECVVVEHQINCCGTRVATGVRSESRAAFDAAEMSCRASYPACGCAELATRADDGTMASGSAQARVECLAGGCTTTFLPATGGSCGTGEATCGLGYSCCYPCGIPGCSSVCTQSCAPGTAGCTAGCRQVP